MSHIHEELEVGAELDQALRSAVTVVAQVMEKVTRAATDRARAAASTARDAARRDEQAARELTRRAEMAERDTVRHAEQGERDESRLAEQSARDTARQGEMGQRELQQAARRELMDQTGAARAAYGPWTYENKVERGDRVAASVAWARAAAWAQQDPRAREAAENLATRISDTFGAEPHEILASINPEHGHPTGVAAGVLSVREADQLAQEYGPYYYQGSAADMFGRVSNTPLNPAQERFVADWQEWAQTGSLPHDTLVRSWAQYVGDKQVLDAAMFTGPGGVIDHTAQATALEQVWDDGREQRDQQAYAAHLADLDAAGMDPAAARDAGGVNLDKNDQGEQASTRSWEPLLDLSAFREADSTEAVAAWRAAATTAAADPQDYAAAAAADQLATQIRTVHGADVATYLADAVSDQQVARTDARRAGEDRAREVVKARQDATEQLHDAMSHASSIHPVPAVHQVGGADMPVNVISAPFQDGHAWYVALDGDTFAEVADLAAPTRAGLGYDPVWVDNTGQVDHVAFQASVRETQGLRSEQDTFTLNEQAPYDPELEPNPELEEGRDAPRGLEAFGVAPAQDLDAPQVMNAPDVATQAVVGTDRGVAPSKASTPQEREHRVSAWREAQQQHAASLPTGTSTSDAKAAWDALPVSQRYSRYWSAYDASGQSAGASVATGTPGSAAAATPAPSADLAPFSATGQEAAVSRERVIELNTVAAQWYAGQLRPGTPGHEYLTGRLGADAVTSGRWSLGYAPDQWNGLARELRSTAGASDQEIVGAGLGRVSSRGTVIDAFRNRAMVAVTSTEGEVVGFYGRDLTGDDRNPTHLNSAGTPAYTKGDHVFGLHEAPPGARLARTEATFDAIAITQASDGQLWGVAPMGTSMTNTQAAAITERAGEGGKVWLANDGDAAGRRATEADFWKIVEHGGDPRLVTMPRGQDPAGLWADDPDTLRAVTAYPDIHASAGLQVLEHAIEIERDALLAGDADAYDRIDMTERDINGVLKNDVDRSFLSAQTGSLLAAVHQERTATPVASGAAGEGPKAREDAGRDQDTPQLDAEQDNWADQAARDSGQESVGDVTELSTARAYNRADTVDLENLSPAARRVAIGTAHGYSRSTTDMLNTAPKSNDKWQAKPSAHSAGPSMNRSKGNRR